MSTPYFNRIDLRVRGWAGTSHANAVTQEGTRVRATLPNIELDLGLGTPWICRWVGGQLRCPLRADLYLEKVPG
jgi:hypothetical protein